MNIRTTNKMLYGNFLTNMHNNMSQVEKYQTQLASGKRIAHLYDDPVGVVKSMKARVKLYRLDQYQETVAGARQWLQQAEAGLIDINDMIKTIQENVTQMANGTWNSDDRAKTAELVAQLRDQLLNFGNGYVNDRYLFAGNNTTNLPFTVQMGVDANGNPANRIFYNGVDMSNPADPDLIAEGLENIQFEVGAGIKMNVTFNGVELMGTGDENLYNIFEDLYNVLMDPNTTEDDLTPYITIVQGAQSRVLASTAVVGGRDNRLQLMTDRYAKDVLSYTEEKSRVEDADEAEAAVHYKMAYALYEASLSVGAKIMSTTLLNYM